jgi:peptide deformylase
MAVHAILQLGNPKLRAVSEPVSAADATQSIFDDLRDTLHEFRRTHGFGRGISAVQIGELKRLIYIEFEGRAYRLRNPEFEWRSEEKIRLWDDCFSFPHLLVWLERWERVRVRYEDEEGVVQTLDAHGALSELLQHEMDHLDGVLAVDRALGPNAFSTREEYERQRREEALSNQQSAVS